MNRPISREKLYELLEKLSEYDSATAVLFAISTSIESGELDVDPPFENLTNLELKILDFIRSKLVVGEQAPTLLEIARHVGHKGESTGTIHRYLLSIQEKGCIRVGKGHRNISLVGCIDDNS